MLKRLTMKKIFILLFVVFLIFDCKNDDDSNDIPEEVIKIQLVTVEVDGELRSFDENLTVDLVGDIRKFKIEDSKSEDWISFEIRENLTGQDFLGEFIIRLNGINFVPSPMSPLGEFTTTINLNNSTGLEGVFSGAIAREFDASAPQIPEVGLTNGVIKIEL